ncbi:MAG: carbohydrate-binding domain-containing protein [Gammaproteobacteria bacterium]|nr:carbohydrate-binding domain-containing protein [Gammaproteobacteria bacterium]
MKTKAILLLVTQLSLVTGLASCGASDEQTSTNEGVTTTDSTNESSDVSSTDDAANDQSADSEQQTVSATDYFITPAGHEQATDYQWDSNNEVLIEFAGDSITIDGTGATANGSILEITSAGTYRLTGSLYNGQVIVDTDDEDVVRLILDNADITNESNAPIYVKSAEKAIIILSAGTYNTLTDASDYLFEGDDDEPNAALFSKDDLTITGTGSLTVNANFNDGITSKDGLIINNGNITVVAQDDAIRGKDYLIINDGNITVDAQGDGFKSDNENADKGYISISAGTFEITSAANAIQAKSNIQISNGSFTLTSGSGNNESLASDASAKGLKATVNIFIDDGSFTIDSADDAIHSNNGITINGASFAIAAGDDAIHADAKIIINDGDINISKSYEGIESGVVIINGGQIRLIASDDGINIAGGTDASGFTPGGQSSGNSDYYLQINDGYTVVNASGDGLDSNGNIEMTGGTVIVNGPTENMNGPLDYDGTFDISGGLLVAVGSSGMVQAPSSDSSQRWLGVTFGTQSAGQLVSIIDNDGAELLTFAPEKNYQSLVFSSPQLTNEESYDLYFGGSSTGSQEDGLYQSGTYSGGTLTYTFTD